MAKTLAYLNANESIFISKIILLSILLFILSISMPNIYSQNEFLNYKSAVLGIEINFPTDWTFIDNGNIVYFQPNSISESSLVNVNIGKSDLNNPNLNLENLVSLELNGLKQTIPDFRILESTKTVLSNHPAF